MNQESNNFNPDDFNTQYQQLNDQSFNSKSSKKINFGLIICIVVATVGIAISAIIFGSKLLNNNNINSESNNSKYENVKFENITGKTKLIKTFENYTDVSECGKNYFTLTNDSETIVVDVNGNIVAKGVNSYSEPYCFDDGTIMMPNIQNGESYSAYSYKIFQNGKEVYTFNTVGGVITKGYVAYDSNVVYYTTYEERCLKAYDLKAKKELWTFNEAYTYNPVLVDNVIIADTLNGKVIINKKTGETIDISNSNYKIYASYHDYYVRVYEKDNTKWLSSVEVYDCNSNLISNLKVDENDKIQWSYMLSNGFYVLHGYDSLMYYVYDFNSKLVKSVSAWDYKGYRQTIGGLAFTTTNVLDNDIASVMEGEKETSTSLIFYSDGRILEYCNNIAERNNMFKLGVNHYYVWTNQEQRTFLLGRDEVVDGNYIIYNFLTGNSKQIGNQEILEDISKELNGGKYLALRYCPEINHYNYKSMFYDENLNKLDYETSKSFYSIKDEWIITDDYYITNILTGDEKKLDINVNGSIEVVRRNAILVKNGDNYELYKFN